MRQGDLAAAEEQLKQATALNPASADIDVAWAKLRLRQTNLIEAEVLLKRAAEASPVTSPIKLTWIDFEVARGNLTAARRSAEELTDKVPEFIPPWTRLANIALIENRFDDCEKISNETSKSH